jgi:Tol biopolymer transport system component
MATRSTEGEARMRTHHGGLVAVALMVAVAGCAPTRGTTDTAPSPADEPTPRPFGTAFERPRGWIAFNDGTGIWAVNAGRTYPGAFSPTKFSDDTVKLAGPAAGDPIAWSADGSRLLVRRPADAYMWPRRVDRQALFVLDADGTETQVTDWVKGGLDGSISPDGTQVVYARGIGASSDPHPYRLEVATFGSGPPAVLLSSAEGHLEAPAFSPEGGRIAYFDGGGDHSNGLWAIDADGSNRRKVAGGDWGHVDGLVWSPDGERLAFNCDCPGGDGAYTIRADGTGLTLVSAGPLAPGVQWSPDGSQVALVHHDECASMVGCVVHVGAGEPTLATLVVVGAAGGEERQLIHFRLAPYDDLGNAPPPLTIAWNPAG